MAEHPEEPPIGQPMKQMKVHFSFGQEDSWHGAEGEFLWALPVQTGGFQVDSIPVLVRGIGVGDVIDADLKDGLFEFRALRRSAGHSTFRVAISPEQFAAAFDRVEELISRIEGQGCRIERGNLCGLKLYAIDIPPEVAVDEIYDSLDDAEHAGLLGFEVAHDAHPD